jgi:serine/threonine-protein kinase
LARVDRRDLTGQVLDARYRIIAPVGQGGMGSVYRAEDIKLGRTVAVKVINEHVPAEMASRRRFSREAQAMAKLEHPHCASILDVGMHDDQPFVVMDFVSGQSLDALVVDGPVPIARAVELTRQILFGLAHAHEHGIIHRDIKPSNIVLSQKAGMGDHVKILDFGLAKLNQENSNLTAGVAVGTPSYMAPEQIRGLLLDARADIYACGVLLFELLTGTKPFRSQSGDPLAICMMHLNDPPPRLADAAPGIDFGALEEVVRHALAKDRDHRFSNAEAFANALATAIPDHAVPTRKTPVPRAATPLPVRPSQPPQPSGFEATISFSDLELADRSSASAIEAAEREPSPASTVQARPARLAQPAAVPAASSHPAQPAAAPAASSRPAQPAAAPAASPRPARRGRWLVIAGALALVAAAIVLAVSRGGGAPGTGSAGSAAVTAPPTADGSAAGDRDGSAGSGSAAAGDRDGSAAGGSAAAGDGDGSGSGDRDGDRPPVDPNDPVATILAQTDELRRDAAIKLLVNARKAYAEDARLPLRLGLLYLDQLWRSEAIKQLRDAIQLEPAYRTDQKLINAVVRAFNSTAGYDWALANFLYKDIGAAARPALEETAKDHPNPVVRNRAISELRRYR